MLWSCLYLRGTEEIVKNFCRVWCIASLIGLSPILAVAILRVNALSPLLTSLAGGSPALVFRVSWDGPTPFCFDIMLTYWSAVLHSFFFCFRLAAGRTAIIHHWPVRLLCHCMCSSYFQVTAAFSVGATAEDLMHAGRWRTPTIALHYKHNSVSFKREVAAKIPSLPCPPTL